MSYQAFPDLPLGFPVHRMPQFSTRVSRHVSGRSVRLSNYSYPMMAFELTFEGLNDSSSPTQGLAAASFQSLLNFVVDRAGQGEAFLFKDPDFGVVTTARVLGIGDGSNRDFTVTAPVGTAGLVPVGQIDLGSTFSAYLDGVHRVADYSLNQPATLHFGDPVPGAGVVVTATYGWYWLCAFDDDTEDFQQFARGLHSVGSLKFSSIKP